MKGIGVGRVTIDRDKDESNHTKKGNKQNLKNKTSDNEEHEVDLPDLWLKLRVLSQHQTSTHSHLPITYIF